jgi:hypothetical protein
LGRFFMTVPKVLEKPTPEQAQANKAVVNSQLNSLYQRYPDRREEIERAIEETSGDVALEYERRGE